MAEMSFAIYKSRPQLKFKPTSFFFTILRDKNSNKLDVLSPIWQMNMKNQIKFEFYFNYKLNLVSNTYNWAAGPTSEYSRTSNSTALLAYNTFQYVNQ